MIQEMFGSKEPGSNWERGKILIENWDCIYQKRRWWEEKCAAKRVKPAAESPKIGGK